MNGQTTIIRKPVGAEPHLAAASVSEIEQHTLARTTALHVLPGVVVLGIYLLGIPLVRSWGFPEEVAKYMFALPLGVIALQLGFLLYLGKRRSGRFTLEGIVLYREPMPVWQYAVLGLIVLGWNALIYVPLQVTGAEFLNKTLFAWAPAWYFAEADYSQLPLTTVVALGLMTACVGAASAVVEGLYFRGYLLPRLSRFGLWAPLISTALFTLYHLDMLGAVGAVFFGSLLPAYIVYWKKNVWVWVMVHASMNFIFLLLAFMPYVFK